MSNLSESPNTKPVIEQTAYLHGSHEDGGEEGEALVAVVPHSRESSRARSDEQIVPNEAIQKHEKQEQHNQETLTSMPTVDPVRPML